MQMRSAEQEARLEFLKREMADRLLPLAEREIYQVRLVGTWIGRMPRYLTLGPERVALRTCVRRATSYDEAERKP